MALRLLINSFYKKPKRLFIIDGIGAFTSAFMLGIILVRLENIFGIPSSTLYLLATFPVLFIFFDCYSYLNNNTSKHLKIIAVMNLLYCVLSIGLTIFHNQTISMFGWAYIIIEIIIIMILAFIQLNVSQKL